MSSQLCRQIVSDNVKLSIQKDTASINLYYPRHSPITCIKIGLVDVRAADDIRIAYDFARDGWSIQQASKFAWTDDEPIDHDWQEVAFVEAWAREQKT